MSTHDENAHRSDHHAAASLERWIRREFPLGETAHITRGDLAGREGIICATNDDEVWLALGHTREWIRYDWVARGRAS